MEDTLVQEMENTYEPLARPAYGPDSIDAVIARKWAYLAVKRVIDIVLSALGLLVLLPFFAVVALLIRLDSPGPVFFRQVRIGKDGRPFTILKFRKMYDHVGSSGANLTLANDQRMTRMGNFLRRYKVDELPQAWNVLIGDMAVVGPRPETPNYVGLYTPEQREVLKVKPGITDYASIYYMNEGDLLEASSDPEAYYIDTILPEKVRLNLKYIRKMSLWADFKCVYVTLRNLFLSLVR